MALRHDSQGFLAGDAIDIGRALSVWSDIRADVRAIRQAIAGGSKNQRPASGPSVDRPVRPVATPGPRDNLGRFVRRDSPGPAPDRQKAVTRPAGRTRTASSSESTQPTASRTHSPVAPVAPAMRAGTSGAKPESPSGRDERGRFSGGGGSGGSGAEPAPAGDGVLRGLFERLTGAASATGGALENADPAVKAVQEVAQPLARGYGMLTGNRSEKRKEGWFRRIYGSLAGFRKDESVFNKASNKSLKTLEDRPAASGNVNVGMMAGMMAGIMPMLTMLFKGILLPIAGAIAAWNVGQWIGEKLYAWMDKAGINAIIFDAFDSAKKWISDGWDKAMLGFKTTTEWMSKSWDSVVSVFKSVYDGLKSLPVIGDAIRAAEKLTAKAVEVVAPAVAVVKQGATDAAAGAKQAYTGQSQAGAGRGSINPGLDTRSTAFKAGEVAGGAAKSVTSGAKAIAGKAGDRWNDAKQYLVGASERAGVDSGVVAKIANFESGFNADAAPIRKDGTRISSAHGYGQFLDGTWTDTLNRHGAKYGVAGAGTLTKEQAKQFRGDKSLQAGMLAEFTKENIEKGRKFGGKDDDANAYAFHNLGDGDAKRLLTGMQQNPAMTVRDSLLKGSSSDKERARVESVISGNKSLYGDGNISVSDAYGRMGQVMRRGEAFAVDARGGVQGAPIAMPAVQTAYAPAPKAPTFAAPAPIADAPPVINPLGTGADSKRPIIVTLPAQDVGQDVSHRGMAHVVTGGLSSR